MTPLQHALTTTRAVILFVGTLAAACVPAVTWAAPRPPNIVLFFIDDLGWRDVGFMGNQFIETPNLDRLARNGLVFDQAYASAPNCAPTRACLMSGQYPPRHGIYTVVDPRQPPGSPWHNLLAAESRAELAPDSLTLAEALRAGGYTTGFFGMWNLGRGRTGPVTPGGQGFDTVVFPETLGFAKDAYFAADGSYLSDRLTAAALEFITDNKNRPFFVYLPDHAVHAPFEPKPDLLEKYTQKKSASEDDRNDPAYAATVEAVDQNVGRLLETLQRLDLSDDTLVLFTSDNGGTRQYTPPLRGGKGELYEGGLRVPLVMAGAGIVQPGRRSLVPTASIDLYPTLLDLANLPPPADHGLDGVSLMPVMQAAKQLPPRQLFWHFPCYVGRSPPVSMVREGTLKLMQFFEDGGRVELYDLANDPSESRNLAQQFPEKATGLLQTLTSWQQETQAALPRGDNPNFNPAAERPRGRGDDTNRQPKSGGGKGSAEKKRGQKKKQRMAVPIGK
ncbi:MAG: DUF4976 domain-containing protein [Planctomycetia bacterium]|nr:DUF4976 domain-containing protein [Planctomycetia bacterium]